MDLAYNIAPLGNRERHAKTIAAWQLAQISQHTLVAYTRNLTDYCSWLDGHGLDLLGVRRGHVDGYRHTLKGAPSTIARALAALSSFYRYAVAEDVTQVNPVERVTRPRVDADHSSTQGLSRDQAKAMLQVAAQEGARSNALVNLLLFTGVRISEALGASIVDYGHDAGHRTLRIQRKGGKVAKVAVPAPAVEALNKYLGTTGADLVHVQAPEESTPLFTTGTGKAWNRSEAFGPFGGWPSRLASRGGSARIACGTRSRRSPWITGLPFTIYRTASVRQIRGPRADTTAPATASRNQLVTTWPGPWRRPIFIPYI